MRALAGFIAMVVLALAGPVAAHASWSPARIFPTDRQGFGQAAIDGRGDAVVAWTSRSPARLRVTLLAAGGRAATRTIASGGARGFVQVVLDARGGATVAWTSGGALYTAHGPLRGRWSAPQRVARGPVDRPVLAVSPERTVVLMWTNLLPNGRGSTAVAWRSTGHRFTAPTTLRRPAPAIIAGEGTASENGAAFDSRGRAYLWSSCDGVVRVSPPHRRTLALVKVAPAPTLGLGLSVTGSGAGLASWVAGRCSTDAAAGSAPGPLAARVIRSGVFGPAVPMASGGAPVIGGSGTQAIALAGDGGLVTTWTLSPLEGQVTMRLDAQGTLKSIAPIAPGRMPVMADAAGNLLLTAPYVGVTVQPAGGGPEQPFDAATGDAPLGVTAVAAPRGVGFAGLFDPDLTVGPDNRARTPAKRLGLSFWRP